MVLDPIGQAIILGILQGLTEFLPISSSAHLLLLPWIAGWQPMGLAFDVMLHVGTLLALLAYFRRDWLELGKDSLQLWSGRPANPGGRLIAALALGTVPALMVGWFFKDFIQAHLRHPIVTVVTLSAFGLLLLFADRLGDRKRTIGQVHWRDGLLIGAAQSLALVPGVSRSGVTITAALFLGLTRTESARFSFLLSTPIVALIGAKQTYDLIEAGPAVGEIGLALTVGVIFSFVSGFLCIKYFLRFLSTRTYLPFVVYRLLLAAFIFSLLLL